MSKKLKGTPDRVWLAGLGALAVAEREGDEFFQDLVEEGRVFKRSVEMPDVSAKKIRALVSTLFENEPASVPARRKRSSRPMDIEAVKARQARRLESARRAFIKEFGMLEEPGRDYERLKQERKVFTVSYRNATYVPSFQFDEAGHPRPAVARVIEILGKDTSDWGLALWFTASVGWLGGLRPVDLLKEEPERVVRAAELEATELVF
jgi:hypothetical protein